MLALFLLGFLLYNEGIQTVMSQASVFAQEAPVKVNVSHLQPAVAKEVESFNAAASRAGTTTIK